MKQIKLSIIALVTLFTTSLFAQQTEDNPKKTNEPKHEIGIDFLELIQNNKVDMSYNYIFNRSNSIGATMQVTPNYTDRWKNLNYAESVGVDLNYRHYFSKKYAQGFYIESFIKYSFGQTHQSIINSPFSLQKDYHQVAIGIGIGYKYVSEKNYFIDVNARFSKTIYKKGDSKFLVPNDNLPFSITLGKRF